MEGKIGRTEDEEEEDVSSYWITLRKRNWNFKEGALDPTL
jgi:hypothetical protein